MNQNSEQQTQKPRPQQNGPEKSGGNTQDDVQVSQPRNDRPEGPFEHSGETAGWTKAEENEKTEEGPA